MDRKRVALFQLFPEDFGLDVLFCSWYNQNMKEVIKSIAGFMAIIIVGLLGVTVSNVMKLGDMNALIMTIDNVARTR